MSDSIQSPTKIIGLQVENVKRIKAVSIAPAEGQAVIEITGKNGQGKSSILDSIQYALGGKKAHPDQPIREGETQAAVILHTDAYIITRTWKGDKTALEIKTANGAKFDGPQDLLDRVTGDLTFDPLAFSRMKPADQIATLKEVAGLNFDELESNRKGAFDNRTDVNRQLKAAKAQLEAAPIVNAPDEEVSTADLLKEVETAMATKQANAEKRTALDNLKAKRENDFTSAEATIARFDGEIADLERKVTEMKSAQELRRKELETCRQTHAAEIATKTTEVEALVDPDTEAIQKKLASADEVNADVRKKKARAVLADQVKVLQEEADGLTAKIEGYDLEKEQILLQAKFPIEGLSFGETGIIYKGLPFNQACSSEQLRVSVAMGLALNPRLKVMLVRDGSLLDSEGRELLRKMAEETGAQVWMERATDGEPIGIVIEDGEVKVTTAPVEGAA